MKTILTVLLSTLVLLEADQRTEAQFTYITNNGTITITGYTGSDGTVTIPDTLGGLPVTGIESNAFPVNTSVTNVLVGSGVTNIDGGAFIGCIRLTSIVVDAANPTYASVTGVLFNQKKGQSIEWFVFDLIWRRPSAVYGFMPRKLRVQYSGAMYHVMSRRDRGEDIFLDEANLHKWMQATASENPTQSHS